VDCLLGVGNLAVVVGGFPDFFEVGGTVTKTSPASGGLLLGML